MMLDCIPGASARNIFKHFKFIKRNEIRFSSNQVQKVIPKVIWAKE